MKIVVVNELKKYYDVHKVAERLSNDGLYVESFPPLVLKTLTNYVEENDKEELNKFLSLVSDPQWKYMQMIFDKPLFHIVYFDKDCKYHSKGINVYALDMMDACDQFISQFGIEPYYCTVKEK